MSTRNYLSPLVNYAPDHSHDLHNSIILLVSNIPAVISTIVHTFMGASSGLHVSGFLVYIA
jgi:hypothetical protein